MATYLDWATQALRELGVLNPIDPPSAEDAATALDKINRIFDNWNAEKQNVWAFKFLSFTLTPNLSPHTIGISANSPTFAVTNVRPNKIYGANLILTNVSPNVNCPIRIVDDQWWLNQAIPDLAEDMPTDLYYEPAWPNGNLFFWPVPDTAYDVQLQIPVTLAQGALTDTISAPPGYYDAVVLTAAEDLSNIMKMPVSPMLQRKARQARARIFNANTVIPRLATRDSGMPTAGENLNNTQFNYRDRSWG